MAGLAVLLQVFLQLGLQPGLFCLIQPFDVCGAIRQPAQYGPGQQDRRGANAQEQPLPAMQAAHPFEPQQAAGNRAGDHHGDGLRQDEQAQDLAAMAHWEPLGDVIQHARKKARLGRAQQKAHYVKTGGALDERHAHGDRAPGDHDPRKPAPRAKALEHQVAGDLKQEITDEEQPRTQPIGGITDADIGAHVQLGEAHGRTVHIRDEVQEDQKRDEFQGDATDKPEFLAHVNGLHVVLVIGACGSPHGAWPARSSCAARGSTLRCGSRTI